MESLKKLSAARVVQVSLNVLWMVGNILSRFKWEYLLFGIGILALAEVFRKGLEYQEDSSSIL